MSADQVPGPDRDCPSGDQVWARPGLASGVGWLMLRKKATGERIVLFDEGRPGLPRAAGPDRDWAEARDQTGIDHGRRPGLLAGWTPPPAPPRRVPALPEAPAFVVECAGCGAPTAHADEACRWCTRPTGRITRAPLRQPAPEWMGPPLPVEFIECTTYGDAAPRFVLGNGATLYGDAGRVFTAEEVEAYRLRGVLPLPLPRRATFSRERDGMR